MKIGDSAYGGIYAGKINGHHIICSTIEYEYPYRINWSQATEYCKSIGMELPSTDELNLLFELRRIAPEYFSKRKYHWYWASTEFSPTHGWGQYFTGGFQHTYSKTSLSYVRPIRRIKVWH